MSINSINQMPAEQVQVTLLQNATNQMHKSSALSQLSLDNISLSGNKDSFSISSSTTSQSDIYNVMQFQNQECAVFDSNSAKNSVNNILTFIQNNGSQVLNSIGMPCASVVLNLISDNV